MKYAWDMRKGEKVVIHSERKVNKKEAVIQMPAIAKDIAWSWKIVVKSNLSVDFGSKVGLKIPIKLFFETPPPIGQPKFLWD